MESNHLSRVYLASNILSVSLDCIETRFKHLTNINQEGNEKRRKEFVPAEKIARESRNNINFSLAPLSILINDNLVGDVMFELGRTFIRLRSQ